MQLPTKKMTPQQLLPPRLLPEVPLPEVPLPVAPQRLTSIRLDPVLLLPLPRPLTNVISEALPNKLWPPSDSLLPFSAKKWAATWHAACWTAYCRSETHSLPPRCPLQTTVRSEHIHVI
jgi:hypothetical protein